MSEKTDNHAATLRDYLRVVRRRKWIILQAVVLVPALAIAFSLHQTKLYRATSEVLLVPQQLANQLNNITDPSVYQQADRRAQTQADLARVPKVVMRAVNRVGVAMTYEKFLSASSATPQTNADLLDLSVTNHSPDLAKQLATAYANAFSAYRNDLDSAPYIRARQRADQQLNQMAAQGHANSGAYADLMNKRDQLDQMIALLTQDAVPVQNAETATQVQPRPVRNAILGFALGIVLGIGLAFLWEALDTRVRSTEEIGERLGLPLLARVPEPSRRLRKQNQLVMVAEPHSPQAETFRMFRTNLDFVRMTDDVKTIVVTSAVEKEGKSTTAANLAVSLARAGKRVALVDLDLRRPYLDRFFDLVGHPGLSEVALGRVALRDAVVPILLPSENGADSAATANGNGKGNGNGSHAHDANLFVLGSGPIPPNPGEFVSSPALDHILKELARRFDTVLIDAPPALQVGDAMTVSAKADGLLIVARMNVVRRPMLSDLHRLLEASPAKKLGFVLTGAQTEDGYGNDGYYGYYGITRKPARNRETTPVA